MSWQTLSTVSFAAACVCFASAACMVAYAVWTCRQPLSDQDRWFAAVDDELSELERADREFCEQAGVRW